LYGLKSPALYADKLGRINGVKEVWNPDEQGLVTCVNFGRNFGRQVKSIDLQYLDAAPHRVSFTTAAHKGDYL